MNYQNVCIISIRPSEYYTVSTNTTLHAELGRFAMYELIRYTIISYYYIPICKNLQEPDEWLYYGEFSGCVIRTTIVDVATESRPQRY